MTMHSEGRTRRDLFTSAASVLGGLAGPGLAAKLAHGSMNAARQKSGEPAIVPRPRFVRVGAGRIELRPDTPVLLGKSLFASEHRWAVRGLLQRFREKQPGELLAVSSGSAALPKGCLLFGGPNDHKDLAAVSSRLTPSLRQGGNAGLGPEGYLISASSDGVRIVANSPAGAFCGTQTLLQTIDPENTMPALEVADAPASPFRGIHVRPSDPKQIPDYQRFIREVLPRHKTNVVIAEINYHFQFRSHPEINEATMFSDAEVRDLARLCRDHNVRLIPLINCFGHQSWRANVRGLLRAYPQFNETPCKPDTLMYSWCASDPRIAPIVFELIDELADAFETDCIHLGMDEVLDLGVCPFCRRKSPAELFAKVVNEFYDHVVRRRKMQMLIWGDRLIDGRKTPYNPMNGSRNGTHPALGMIPKDIFLCDWHYHLHDSYPSVEMFRDAGFEFVACGWRTKQAIRAFIEYASKHGGKNYRGYLATNWSPFPPIARYLLEGVAEGEDAADIRNVAECYQLGMELAWTGAEAQASLSPDLE